MTQAGRRLIGCSRRRRPIGAARLENKNGGRFESVPIVDAIELLSWHYTNTGLDHRWRPYDKTTNKLFYLLFFFFLPISIVACVLFCFFFICLFALAASFFFFFRSSSSVGRSSFVGANVRKKRGRGTRNKKILWVLVWNRNEFKKILGKREKNPVVMTANGEERRRR